MTTLVVPPLEERPWPSLGPAVCQFLEERAVFGPGSLKGEPLVLDAEKRGIIHRAYEVFPRGHPFAGRRRFRRVAVSLRKGTAKTELAALLAYAELHPEAPVRCDGFDQYRRPVGRPVRDPYIPMVAYTEEQVEELAYGALYVIVTEGPDADLFDAGLDRIIRLDARGRADGKAVPLAGSPSARDGARTTWQNFDEPLALSTVIPTPLGWKTMAEIGEGDQVYGRDGAAVRVLGKSPVQIGRACFRVTFSDGNSTVTDGAHRWKAIEWSNRPAGEQVVTTQHMCDRGVTTTYGPRWRLPRHNGFDGQTADVPIDPYLLGMWLGDGATDAGYIHTSAEDYPHLSADIEHTVSTSAPGLVRWLPTGLRAKLRAAGLIGHKHVPDAYLFADREQRLQLLRGLMDTDGSTSRSGACTFVQGRRELAEQVAMLVRSLGADASLVRRPDQRARHGEMWKVHFSPAFPPFRLPRKAARFSWAPRRATSWPAIVAIDPVESEPVQCLGVDSADHLFLVGRGLHLTHNTHRLFMPRQVEAYETMLANLDKRPLDDPWSMEQTTAGQLGQNSIAENTHVEAEQIAHGEIDEPQLFYLHRDAGPGHDMSTLEGRIAAIAEATGPVGEFGPGQFRNIAKQWDRPRADRSYLERVWTNRWTTSEAQAFDVARWAQQLARPEAEIPRGAIVVGGFDGARFRDSTGIVLTDVRTGLQHLWAGWARPANLDPDAEWEVPEDEVTDAWEEIRRKFRLWKAYCDPPHWTETVGAWEARWPDQFEEWWTNRRRPMAEAIRAYKEGQAAGQVTHTDHPDLNTHIGNAGRQLVNLFDDQGNQLYILCKIHPTRKFDYAMAGCLSWRARLDALKDGALRQQETYVPKRLR